MTQNFHFKAESKKILGKLRDIIPPYKSSKYLIWVKSRFPDYEIHHILGSHLGRKNTDYLVVPLDPEVHRKIQKHYYKWILPHLNTATLLLSEYATELGLEVKTITKIEELKQLIEQIKEREKE